MGDKVEKSIDDIFDEIINYYEESATDKQKKKDFDESINAKPQILNSTTKNNNYKKKRQLPKLKQCNKLYDDFD